MFYEIGFIYKILFLLTLFFHPVEDVRKFAWWYSVTIYVAGMIKLSLPLLTIGTEYWYLVGVPHELVICFLAGVYLPCRFIIIAVCIQSILVLYVNIHQYVAWTDYDMWFLDKTSFSKMNGFSFEIVLGLLWFKHDIVECIKQRSSQNTIIMFCTLLLFIRLSGNY